MKIMPAFLSGALWLAALQSPACLPAQQKTESEKPVAVVNGSPIEEGDLDAGSKLLQLEQEAYQVRLEALEKVIDQKLLEQEAAEKNVTVDELIEQEIEAKVADPSSQEVEAFYERQKARIKRPLEEVRGQIEQFIKNQNQQKIRQAYLAQLREKSDIEIFLDAPRIPVEIGDSPRRGPEDAPVTIIEFSDFQCPYCKRAQATLRQIQEKYGDKVQFVYKDLPLREIHPEAQQAAEAAHCAGDQGKYWEYQRALFDSPRITRESFPELASSLGLDAVAFQKCLDSGKHQPTVEAHLREAIEAGATSTPTFFVNGILLRGSQPLESFAKIIDHEIAAAK